MSHGCLLVTCYHVDTRLTIKRRNDVYDGYVLSIHFDISITVVYAVLVACSAAGI